MNQLVKRTHTALMLHEHISKAWTTAGSAMVYGKHKLQESGITPETGWNIFSVQLVQHRFAKKR